MKNSKFILPLTLILISLTSLKSHAQVVTRDFRIPSENETVVFSGSESGTTTTANLKAETNFKKDYTFAREAQWSVFADKSLMCRFYLNNILHRAFYTPRGNWTYTISGYDGSKLNTATANRIKSVYYNFRIVYADQIDLVSDRTFYVVEIQDEKTIRKIRVNENDIEVLQEFPKP